MILSALYAHLCSKISDLEARRILEERGGFRWADIIANPEQALNVDVRDFVLADLVRRMRGEPLSRIYGRREFWGLDFELSADTLDPRPDTEVLVERALALFSGGEPETILDLGTGSGCIAVALLSEWSAAKAVAVDISPEALKTARRNARRHGVEDRIVFVCGSWGQSLGSAKFDLVVSNPPYISNQEIANLAPEVRNHDPILALDGGDEGLDAYKKIFSVLKNLFSARGKALFEIGAGQRDDVMRLAEESGLSVHGIYPDYAGRARVVEISCGDK